MPRIAMEAAILQRRKRLAEVEEDDRLGPAQATALPR
jgi:hypothetical protein